jgi:anti-sigma factor RsiW
MDGAPVKLDDQLAALAAGELDDDTARALEARVAGDAVLAQRLARFRRLHQLLEVPLEPVPMSADASARLDAALDDALAALPATPLRAVPLTAPAEVVDLATARARRSTPRWVGALTGVAAAVAAVAVLGGPLLTGSGDDALVAADAGAERIEEEAAADAGADSATAEMAPQQDDPAVEDSGAAGATSPVPGPSALDLGREVQVLAPFALEPGTEADLVDELVREYAATGTRAQQLDVLAALDGPAATCAAETLAGADDGIVLLALGAGTWDGSAAVAAVLDGAGPGGATLVLISSPDCVELARALP